MHKYKLVGHKGLVSITVMFRLSSLVWLCLCPVVYVCCLCLVVLSGFMGLADNVWQPISRCLYLASLSGRLYLHGCSRLAVYVWLSRSGCLCLVFYSWLPMSECQYMSGCLYLYLVDPFLHDYIWQPIFACVCLTPLGLPVYAWMSISACLLWLSMSGCPCLAVLSGCLVWLFVTGCPQNVWLSLFYCLSLTVLSSCVWPAVYVWQSMVGCLCLDVFV